MEKRKVNFQRKDFSIEHSGFHSIEKINQRTVYCRSPFPTLLNVYFFFTFSTARWWAEGGAGCEGLAVAQSAQHEALCRSEPLHPHTRQREGGAWISGTQRKRRSVGELCHLTVVFISCKVPDSSHQNTPLNLTQTQTHPVTRTALPHPLLFHNFTSSSFSPIMPRDSVVSHGKSHHDLIELHCIAFICPAGPWECIFGFSASVCVFALCVHTGVCACQPVRLIPWIWYDDEFTQENSVPLQHFLQLQEVVCFVTDERCWEADWGLLDPDPLGCQT